MIRLLFRKDIPRSIFFLLVFLVGIFLHLDAFCYHDLMYSDDIDAFIETYYTGDTAALYEAADKAYFESLAREQEIYALRDPENPDIGPSLMDQLAGGPPSYTSRSLQELHNKLFNEPGKYSKTIRTDISMTAWMRQMLAKQKAVNVNIKNSILLTERALARSRAPVMIEMNNKLLALHKEAGTLDIPLNTLRMSVFFSFWDKDITIYLLIFLLTFWIFSSANQSGVSGVALCSRRGARWFALQRIIASVLVNTLVYALYVVMIIVCCGENVFTSPVMDIPVQFLPGMESAPWPISLGEYMVCVIVIRYLICTALSMLVLLCSACVRRVSLSLVLGAVPTAVLCLMAGNTFPLSSRINGLCSGDFSKLFEEYAFLFPFNIPLYVVPFYFAAFVVVILLAATATVCVVPHTAQR